MNRLVLLILLMLLVPAILFAHGGRTNSSGCHTNRSTGDYHCHNGGKSTNRPSKTYCHVFEGEFRCGYAKGSCKALKRSLGGYCKFIE